MFRAVYFVAASLIVSVAAQAQSHALYTVDQITEYKAGELADMFRFSPDLLEIPLGGTVAFTNFTGNHTVISIRKMTPDGGPKFKFSKLDKNRQVSFDVSGLYGVTCGNHGRYGMGMIIQVGPVKAAEIARARGLLSSGPLSNKFSELLSRLEKSASQ